jgi:hypothetical protein
MFIRNASTYITEPTIRTSPIGYHYENEPTDDNHLHASSHKDMGRESIRNSRTKEVAFYHMKCSASDFLCLFHTSVCLRGGGVHSKR